MFDTRHCAPWAFDARAIETGLIFRDGPLRAEAKAQLKRSCFNTPSVRCLCRKVNKGQKWRLGAVFGIAGHGNSLGGNGTNAALGSYSSMTQTLTDAERAKKRAETNFRARVREIEGQKASKEYWAAQQEAIDRIPRLRALRLEREAQERQQAKLDKAAKLTKPAKAKKIANA